MVYEDGGIIKTSGKCLSENIFGISKDQKQRGRFHPVWKKTGIRKCLVLLKTSKIDAFDTPIDILLDSDIQENVQTEDASSKTIISVSAKTYQLLTNDNFQLKRHSAHL